MSKVAKTRKAEQKELRTLHLAAEIEWFCQWFVSKEKNGLVLEEVQEHEFRLLAAVITEDGMALGQVAKVLGQNPGHVGRALGQLERKGLVHIESGTKDARERRVNVTECGRTCFDRCSWYRSYLTQQLFEMCPPETQSAALSLFQELNRAIGRMNEDLYDGLAKDKATKTRARNPVFRKKARGRLFFGGTAAVDLPERGRKNNH